MDLEKLLRDALAPCEPGPEPEIAVMARIAALRRRPRRLVVITSVAALAAAAATLIVTLRDTTPPEAVSEAAAVGPPATPALAAVQGAAVTAVAPAIVTASTDEPPASKGVTETAAAPGVTLDPHTIVVVRRPEQAADVQAIALADRCYQAVTTELRGLGGLNVVTDPSAFTDAAFSGISLPERDQKIARSHGAGHLLAVTTQMGCNFALFNSQTGAGVTGAGGGGVDPQGGREYVFAQGMARGIHVHILGDSSPEPSALRANLLNAAYSDRERTTALARLLQDRPNIPRSREAVRNILDKEVLAAAIQLGTKSPDAEVRSAVWAMLRDANDPATVQPLLQTIAADPDRSVRFQAIQSVRKFLDVPGVREALQRAATLDTDSQPERFCCTVTVREAAERASVPDAEFRTWVRSKLLDESLPGRSRLINLMGFSSDGRFAGTLSGVGSDSAAIVFEVRQRDPDPRVRAMAWDVLYSGQADREFLATQVVPVLLDDLRTSTNERVRGAAARILFRYNDQPDVQEAIQRAQSDESIIVRRAATGAPMAPASAE